MKAGHWINYTPDFVKNGDNGGKTSAQKKVEETNSISKQCQYVE